MSNIYGRQIIVLLANKSGGGVIAGDVVVPDGSNDSAFTTTTSASSTVPVWIAQETLANNATGRVLIGGYAALVNVNASVTRGHYGATHTVAKQAADGGASRTAGTFCRFITGGTTPIAYVYPTDLLGTSLSNPMTTKGDVILGDTGGTPTRLQTSATSGDALLSQGAAAFPAWGAVAPVGSTYLTVASEAVLTAEVPRPELDDLSLSGASNISLASMTDDAGVTDAAEANMARSVTFTTINARATGYVATAVGTGDFDFRMRITDIAYLTPDTTTSIPRTALFVADTSGTASTRLAVEVVWPATTTGSISQVYALINTTISGQDTFGIKLPIILRIKRVGTTVTFYSSTNEGRFWTTLSTTSAATNFARVGIMGHSGNTVTPITKVLIHWLRSF